MGFFRGLSESYSNARVKQFVEHASGCILAQLRTAQSSIGDKAEYVARLREGFVLGYTFGCCLSVMETMRLNSKHADEAFQQLYSEIFGASGPAVLDRSMRIFEVTQSLNERFEREGVTDGLSKAAKSAGADDDFSFEVGLMHGAGETEAALLQKVRPRRLESFMVTGSIPAY